MNDAVWQLIPKAVPSPLVLSVPHAGRHYPLAMNALARLSVTELRPLEDRFADALIESALEDGHQAVVGLVARAWIDLNRREDELDIAMFNPPQPTARVSGKVRGGLGLVPRRIAAGDIWRAPLTLDDLETRLQQVHRPFHTAVAQALKRALAVHGVAILLDVHSMPGLRQENPPQIVLGTLYGRSCGPDIVDAAIRESRVAGMRTAENAPYAGGHVLERHGAPHHNIHALQIEVDRGLYLDAAQDRPGAGLPTMRQFMRRLCTTLVDTVERRALPIAAE
jgi:N-formylglutamate amidohydrolase